MTWVDTLKSETWNPKDYKQEGGRCRAFTDTPAGYGSYDLLTSCHGLQPPASLFVTAYYIQFACVLVISLSQATRSFGVALI